MNDQPFSHNRIIPETVLNDAGREYYSMGESVTREALVIKRDNTDEMYVI